MTDWTSAEERWRERGASFVLPDRLFAPTGWEVVPLIGGEGDRVARAFIERHHYAPGYPAARYRFGLFSPKAELCGVAVFSQPVNNRTLTKHLPALRSHLEGVDLGRFVLLDEVGHGGESWFLSRCFELLASWPEPPAKWEKATGGREPWLGVRGVVSFSDPVPRRDASGEATLVGHWGTIYQATATFSGPGRYVGRGSKATLTLLANGQILAPRGLPKVRNGEVGADAVIRQLVEAGAVPPQDGEDLARWVNRAEEQVALLTFRHQGNHKYVWALPGARGDRTSKRLARVVRASLETVPALPRPKTIDPEPRPVKRRRRRSS